MYSNITDYPTAEKVRMASTAVRVRDGVTPGGENYMCLGLRNRPGQLSLTILLSDHTQV